MKISVIMPVYNAAATLQHSLMSISGQSYRDFEVVFVDDCSTDDSLSIIETFAAQSGICCRIIRLEHNSGVAAARNKALEAASGEYIVWADADDRIGAGALERIAGAAADSNADIVGWDWTLGFDTNGRYMRQADYSTPLEALKALMGGTMRWNLWLFMTRRTLLQENGISFIDGANMGEDMMLMIKAFLKAGKVCQIHESLYDYNAVSTSSMSRQFRDERRTEICRNVAEVERSVAESVFFAELGVYTDYLKLYVKLPLLMSADRSDYELWYGWFNESNRYASANKKLPLRTRTVQWMASHRWWTGVRLYYVLVYKFVYGIIYR